MRICSFITLYKPDFDKLKANIAQILLYAKKIYLLVNDSHSYNEFWDEPCVKVVMNGKNIGLSAAFNIALKEAAEDGFDEAVLFDQDSFLSKKDFERMNEEFIEEKRNNPVMCIGPSLSVCGNVLSTPKWTLSKQGKETSRVFYVKNIITSGMVLDIKMALSVGGFEETLPVDFCDFYFCYKSIYNGFLILKSKDSFLQHEIGNSSMKIGKSTIHFHAPYRNYFLVRDTLRIVFCFKETPFSIRTRYFIFLLPRMVLFLFKCDKKRERLRMYWLGLKDFCLGRYGFGSIAELLNAN